MRPLEEPDELDPEELDPEELDPEELDPEDPLPDEAADEPDEEEPEEDDDESEDAGARVTGAASVCLRGVARGAFGSAGDVEELVPDPAGAAIGAHLVPAALLVQDVRTSPGRHGLGHIVVQPRPGAHIDP